MFNPDAQHWQARMFFRQQPLGVDDGTALTETGTGVNNCTGNTQLNAALNQRIELLNGWGGDPVAFLCDRMLTDLDRSQQGIHAALPLTLRTAARDHGFSENTIESCLIALAR